MKVSSKVLIGLVLCAVISVPVVAFLQPLAPLQALQIPPSARDGLRRIWERARESGAYRFSADIDQTSTPVASVVTVGRQTRRDRLHIEGETNLTTRQLTMTLWSQGGSLVDANSGLQVRVDGDKAYGRKAGQDWQPVENFTGLFAPESDFMTFLVAATNVMAIDAQTHSGVTFNAYSFEINGPGFANHMRDQMQQRLTESGELPPNMQLGVSDQYLNMTGVGELWASPDGLPVRQLLRLQMPGRSDEQVRADVSVDFYDFNRTPPATAAPVISPRQAADALQTSLMFAAMLGLAVALMRYGRSRKVFTAMSFLIITSMLTTPVMQAAQSSSYMDRQRELAQEDTAKRVESDMAAAVKSLRETRTTPTRQYQASPAEAANTSALSVLPASSTSAVLEATHAVSATLPANDGTDTDQDGLTDYVEAILGTDPLRTDSDGDLITDTLEVRGFVYGGLTWHTNPLKKDSNDDGIDDGREWTLGAVAGLPADSDNDGTPDLYDDDNDGDSVPDNLDLSPYTAPGIVFSGTHPLELKLDNLTPDKVVYAEFQLRPIDPEHLWYAYNVFDWPKDDLQGNIQDADGRTFRDVDTSLTPSPYENGDMQLVPMLELRIPAGVNHLPDETTLNNYGIAVQPMPNNEKSVFVPLQLTTEDKGSRHVAFYGKMLYLPTTATWGNAHQARLVWAVRALVDRCEEFEDGLCKTYAAYNEVQIVHTYDDAWTLTGFSVRENHGSDVAAIYEDTAVDDNLRDDTVLWQMAYGLDQTFLAGRTITDTNGNQVRDITAVNIYDRFNHATNSGVSSEARWEISNTLGITFATYTHLDAAVMSTAMTTTKGLLDTYFTPHWTAANPISPTLLFARDDRFRALNLENADPQLVNLSGRQLTFNFDAAAVPVETLASLNWAPYQFNGSQWASQAMETYWDELGARHEAEFITEYVNAEEAGGALALARIYYLALMQGVNSLVQTNTRVLTRDWFYQDKPLGATVAAGARGGALIITTILAKNLLEPSRALVMLNNLITSKGSFPKAGNPLGTGAAAAAQIFAKLEALWASGSYVKLGLIGGAALIVVAGIGVGLYYLAKAYMNDSPAAKIATAVIVGAVLTYLTVIAPILVMIDTARALQSITPGLSMTGALGQAARLSGEVTKAGKIAGAVGLVISIGIVWGVFIYAVVDGGVTPGSQAFSQLLAAAIAATILAIILFVVSLTVIGAIIVAIISVIDLLLTLLGVGFTITGWVSEAIAKAIYNFELVAKTDVKTGAIDMQLVTPERGLAVGNTAVVQMPITTTIEHTQPNDPRLFWPFFYFYAYWTKSKLKQTTFRYELNQGTSTIDAGMNDMANEWAGPIGTFSHASATMYRYRNVVSPTVSVVLTSGINISLPVNLSTAYAIPGVECWTYYLGIVPPFYVNVCVPQDIDGESDTPIGDALIYDVLPETLDGFIALDWGRTASFGAQLDHDGDGLISRVRGGNDPDDRTWDTDGDGLSDRYEMLVQATGVQNGGSRMSPLDIDSDLDGLTDAQEIRLGTDPGKRDTDGDGIDDGAEVFHQDLSDHNNNNNTTEWLGGYTYTIVYTTTGNLTSTITTRMTSDPLNADEDGDDLNDLAEKTLYQFNAGYFHPRVFNDNPIALAIEYDDEDRIVRPGQSIVVTTTVRNNIAAALYALGGLTVTMPAALGGLQPSRTYNIYSAEASTIVTTATVLSNTATSVITISAVSNALLHNGDLSTTWVWDPPGYRTALGSTSPRYPHQTALSGLSGSGIASYIVASTEGGQNPVSGTSNVLSASVQVRQAGNTAFTDALEAFRNSDTYHPLGKIGAVAPDIACTTTDKCVSAWVGVDWETCADVTVTRLDVHQEDDAGAVGEYYIELNGSRVWGPADMDGGDTRYPNVTRRMCNGQKVGVWEDDDSPNSDDRVIEYAPDLTAPHSESKYGDTGDRATIYITINPAPLYTVKLRVSNPALSAFENNASSYSAPLVTQLSDVAVATNGNDRFAVAWKQGDQGILQTHRFSTLFTYDDRVRFDDTAGDDTNIQLEWMTNRYAIVWQNAGNIRLAFANQNAQLNTYLWVANGVGDAIWESNPTIALDGSGRALIAYTVGTRTVSCVWIICSTSYTNSSVKGRFITTSGLYNYSLGPEFTLVNLGGQVTSTPIRSRVARDAFNQSWLVTWSDGSNVKYQPFDNGTQLGPLALLPASTIPSAGALANHDAGCVGINALAHTCGIVTNRTAVGGNQNLNLYTTALRGIPPWLGAINTTLSSRLTVDANVPTATITSLSNGVTLNVSGTLIIGGDALDATSNIASVEVSVDNEGWQPANGAESWAFAWDLPVSDGAHTLRVRATDVAGNVGDPSTAITVNLDRSPPTANSSEAGNPILGAVKDGADRWRVTLSGSASDIGSSVQSVEGLVSPSGSGWQTATLNTGSWALDYLLSGFDADGNALVDASGQYTLALRAMDTIGNQSAEIQSLFRIDTQAPVVDLRNSFATSATITQTLQLGGVITDAGDVSAGVQSVEIDFVPSGQSSYAWQAAALAESGSGVYTSTWSYNIPDGIEGNYLINLRGVDVLGNVTQNPQLLFSGWQGEIDTLAPRAALTVTYEGQGNSARTVIKAWMQDLNLSEEGLQFVCPVKRADRVYYSSPWWDAVSQGALRLYELTPECKLNGFIAGPITLSVADTSGRVTSISADMPALPAGASASMLVAQPPSVSRLYLPVVGADENSGQPKVIASPLAEAVASTVLTPAHGTALTTLDQVEVVGGAYAADVLKTLTLYVNGVQEYSASWSVIDNVTDTLWSTMWTPPGEGVYTFTTVVEDQNSVVQTTLQPTVVTVDTQAPQLTLDAAVLTTSHRLSFGRVALTGSAVDAVGIEQVVISVDGGAPQIAVLGAGVWNLPWYVGSDADGVQYDLTITATDRAYATVLNQLVTVDIQPPAEVAVTLGYTNSGNSYTPIMPGDTVNAAALLLDWAASSGGSGVAGYHAGYTASPTAVLASLTSFGPSNTRRSETATGEATAWMAHLVTHDTLGNATTETLGPVYVDSPLTPDYIGLSSELSYLYRGWMDSGCSLIGADRALARNAASGSYQSAVQRLYFTWDAANLRLAWTGADWDNDGDLFIYLDTAAGGSTNAYNPFAAPMTITLPAQNGDALEADYVIWVQDAENAQLMQWNGSAWTVAQTLGASNFQYDPSTQDGSTDLLIPFTWLESPTALKLVALASENTVLHVWAAMPDKNPLNSQRSVSSVALPYLNLPFTLTQQYAWSNLGAGVCPASGQFEDADLHASMSVEPVGVFVGFQEHNLAGMTPPGALLDSNLDGTLDQRGLPLDTNPDPIGQGLVVSYTLRIANEGQADATGVVVTLTARGGLEFPGTTQVLSVGTLGAGMTATLEFSARVNTTLDGESGEINAEVADAVHGPFDWLWVQHDIDTLGPENVNIVSPMAYIGAFTTTIRGTSYDRSTVPGIELQNTLSGTTQTCTDATPADGEWACPWFASGLPDGTVVILQARGTDRWGNVGSYGNTRTLTVDTVAPVIALNAQTTSILASGILTSGGMNMGGTVTDNRQAGQAEICVVAEGETDPTCASSDVTPGGQPIGNWLMQPPIPASTDGVTYTLLFYGLDAAGNRSVAPLTRTVYVDLSGPTIGVNTYVPKIGINRSVTALAGSVFDGAGIETLRLRITSPNPDPARSLPVLTIMPLNPLSPTWSYSNTFRTLGIYQIGVEAVDKLGNISTVGTFDSEVLVNANEPPEANAGGPYAADEGTPSIIVDGSNSTDVNPYDVLSFAWDFDNDGIYDEATGITATLSIASLDGPNLKIIGLRVTDDGGLTSTVTTTVSILNVDPVLTELQNTSPISENRAVTLTAQIVEPGVTDALTLTVDWADGTPVESLYFAAGTIYITLTHYYSDDIPLGTPVDDFEVVMVVSDDDAGASVSSTVVTVENIPPEVTANKASQTVQYSDRISQVVISATDNISDLLSLGFLTWVTNTLPITDGASGTEILPPQMDLSTGPCVDAGFRIHTCTWILSGTADLALAPYVLGIGIVDDDAARTNFPLTLTVVQEDARVTYTGAVFASTDSTTNSKANVLLAATVRDITAVTDDPAWDPWSGDIRKSTVSFLNRDTNTYISGCTNLRPNLVIPNDLKTGTVTCNYVYDLGSRDADNVTIAIVVGDYYTRNSTMDDTVVNVSKNLASFITGGGFITATRSGGTYAAAADTKINFGFNVKYNKNKTNLQGNANIIVRNGGRVYQIKSNATNSLRSTVLAKPTVAKPSVAEFDSKANITDITNPLAPISIEGNGRLRISMTDAGEPGSNDKIAITVWNKNGVLWFTSDWDGTKTIEKNLVGGNLRVR